MEKKKWEEWKEKKEGKMSHMRQESTNQKIKQACVSTSSVPRAIVDHGH